MMPDVFLRYCFFPLFSPHQLNKDPVAHWITVVLKLWTWKWWLCFSSLGCIFKISVAVPRLEVIIKASLQSDVDAARIDCILETCHKHVWSSHIRQNYMGELNRSLEIYTQRVPKNVLSVLKNSVNHRVCGFSLVFLEDTHICTYLYQEKIIILH